MVRLASPALGFALALLPVLLPFQASPLPAAVTETPAVLNLPTPIRAAWQMEDGSLYAVDRAAPHPILKLTPGGWEETGAKVPAHTHLVAYSTRDGSSWLVITERDNPQKRLWRWDGPGHEPFETGLLPDGWPQSERHTAFSILEDDRGRVWLGAGDARLLVIENGTPRVFLTIGDDQIYPIAERYRRESPGSEWLGLYLLSNGRVAVVSRRGNVSARVLSGIIIIEGDDATWMPESSFEGLDENAWLTFRRADENYLYYYQTRPQKGIIRLDINTRQSEVIQEVALASGESIYAWFPSDGDTPERMIVSMRRNRDDWFYTDYTFMEWRGDRWEGLSEDFTHAPGGYNHREISLIETEDALWVGTTRMGLMRVDLDNGSIREVNWREGLHVDWVNHLVPMPDGRVWVGSVSPNSGTAIVNLAALDKDPPTAHVQELYTPGQNQHTWAQTPDGEIYRAIRVNNRGGHQPGRYGIERWNSATWERFDGFKDVIPSTTALLADAHHRLWSVSRDRETRELHAVIIPTRATENWHYEEGPFTILLADYAREPEARFMPSHYVNPMVPTVAVDGQGGAMYFNDNNRRYLIHYDGEQWQETDVRDVQVVPTQNFTGFVLLEDGSLGVTQGHNHVLRPDKSAPLGWVPYSGDYQPLSTDAVQRAHNLPRTWVDSWPSPRDEILFCAVSNSVWIQANDSLYRTFATTGAPYLPEEIPTPFYRRMWFQAYFEDNFGNHLFIVANNNAIIVPKNPVPEVSLTINGDYSDASQPKVIIQAPEAISCWRWRINQGPWSDWARDSLILGENILPGDYLLEVQPVAANMEIMPGLHLEIALHYDIQNYLDRYIVDLFSEDWDLRAQAVRGLVLDPGLSLLKLQDILLDNLSRDDKWWLQTALQQVTAASNGQIPVARWEGRGELLPIQVPMPSLRPNGWPAGI